ncbi:MAG: 16S rRNA (uracil(1498)-N(3))-methyltransferase [Clostridiales bacterium]|jgi:16S rRNA (uracil1498-N3)-methyltransferase|nr:16S rRNA (uracil(1498)-N(3))-methyltransferase [Clostridiales bacterium]
MHRFFIENRDIEGQEIRLTGENAAHGRVLRLRVGEEIVAAVSGGGIDYFCTVSEIAKSEILAEITRTAENKAEPAFEVVLFQALPKGGKMAEIVEHATELGVSAIVPFVSERCLARGENILRWQRIAESAAKLSHRGKIPQIHEVLSFREAVSLARRFALAFACYELENQLSIINYQLSIEGSLAFFVGPEGGFTPEEADYFRQNGILTVSLGSRILRTQSAAAFVMAIINYQLSIIN